MSDNLQPAPVSGNSESNNMALLVWVGAIFFGWLVPLIMYLVKKDDAFVQEVAKEALNWAITAFIAGLICSALMVVLIGLILLPALLIANLVFCILGAVAASKGEVYRVPFCLRLIK